MTAFLDELIRRNSQRITAKQIREAEARGLMPAPRRLGPFRFYCVEDFERAEQALRAMGRLPAKREGAAVA